MRLAPTTLLPALFAVAASLPASARAAGPGAPAVHVLEIATDDADDQAKALTSALKSRVKASKDYSLADGDHSLAVISLALKCGDVPDAKCQTKIAERINTERYVWGVMKKSGGGQVALELHLFVKGQPDVKHTMSYAENLTEPLDPALQKIAEQLVLRLTNAGKVGSVVVTTDLKGDAELFVDGASHGKFAGGQGDLLLPNGDHTFELRSGGKVLAQGAGKVASTGVLTVRLAPVAVGEATTTSVAVTPSGGSDWRKTAGYVGLGVGGAALLGGVYSMIKVNSLNNDESYAAYRKGFKSDVDVCEKARAGVSVKGASSPADIVSVCDSGSTFTTLQYVLFPVGALAAGAGAYFLFAPSGGERVGGVRVTPAVGPTAGGVDVRVAF